MAGLTAISKFGQMLGRKNLPNNVQNLSCVLGSRTLSTTSRRDQVKWLEEHEKVRKVLHNIDRTQFNSGDKDAAKKGDVTRLRWEYRNCQEMTDASPELQKLCSLEYAFPGDLRKTLKKETVASVNRCESDETSIEAGIARLTVAIRHMQFHSKTRTIGSHDGRGMALLNEMVQRRRKHLSWLRRWDYNKFQYMLEKLNLTYTPKLVRKRLTAHDIYRGWTQYDALTVRRDKFVKLHNALKAQQELFVARKSAELQAIEEEEATIRKQLEELSQKEDRFRTAKQAAMSNSNASS